MERGACILALALAVAACDEPAPGAESPPGLASALPVPMFPPPPGVSAGITAHYGVGTSLDVHVSLGIPETVGPLSPSEIGTVLSDHAVELEFCYTHALEGTEDTWRAGRVVATFTVRADGAATRPVTFAEDHVGLPALTQCVAGSVAGWPYPTSTAETQVRIAIDFTYDPPPPG